MWCSQIKKKKKERKKRKSLVKVKRFEKKEVDVDEKSWDSRWIDLQKGRKGKEVPCCSLGALSA